MQTLELTTPIISTDWLSEHVDHPDLVILDATIKKVTSDNDAENANIQIKNTRFFDIKGIFSDKTTAIPNMLPPTEEFESACRNLGICNHHKIVVYDKLGIYSSARVWWMFTAMGYNDVAILDGGLPAWQEAGLPVELSDVDPVNIVPGNFTAAYQPNLVANASKVISEMISPNTLILDARSRGRFMGTAPEPRADLKGGHIPNSVSLPYTEVIKDGKMLPQSELKETFKNFDIANKNLIFTCGSGITACIILMAAKLAGYHNTSVYDGSWSEWGQLEGVPIEC